MRKKPTLLESFISTKMNHHPLPERAGKNKGDSIGFPLNKFKASLLSLTVDTQQGIAKSAGVSYGLLRKWKTEKKFRDEEDNHRREFVQIFIRHFETRVAETTLLLNEHLKKPIKKILDEPCQALSVEEYRDMGKYDNEMLYTIVEALDSKFINECKGFSSQYSNFLNDGKKVHFLKEISKPYDLDIISRAMEVDVTYRFVIEALMCEGPLEEDRITAITKTPNLKLLEDDFINICGAFSESLMAEMLAINKYRQKLNGLMIQIVGSLLLDHYPLKDKHRKLAIYLNSHVLRTMW
jgi:hypothetical protein